ncbi:MAG: hypothetical protein COA42_16250 [Alteromonadaceae bacterium]|nr:MAG: hypothetical protein COA42_16250 [Alteromonadaceae bacterium]
MSQTTVCALYKFVALKNYESLRQPLLDTMLAHEVRGTILLALEGVNGTIAGTQAGIDVVLAWLEKTAGLGTLSYKLSFNDENPFYRSKVKLKKEIVTMGVEGIDPSHVVGTYVKPKDWNALISDPEVLLVDTRNDYEVEIGTFKGALNPDTQSFRQFPEYVSNNLDNKKHKRVAMFCTGGIRCEKSTAYLKQEGFEEVYHLEGGILKYLEEVPAEESLWEGECFVFDGRVAVNHALEKGQYDQCFACRYPITEEQMQSPLYIKGVSCPRCHDKHSEEQLGRFKERERQMRLAQERGEEHIGGEVKGLIESRRQQKHERRRAEAKAPKVD